MMASDISCPVDHIQVSGHKVRLTALLVFLTGISYLFTGHWLIALLLTVDFFLRGFGFAGYSPLNIISGWLAARFFPGGKQVDRAPKVFAAQLGFLLSDLLLIAGIFQLNQTAYSIDGILLLFSFLESALAFCAGCYVYSGLKKIFPKVIA